MSYKFMAMAAPIFLSIYIIFHKVEKSQQHKVGTLHRHVPLELVKMAVNL